MYADDDTILRVIWISFTEMVTRIRGGRGGGNETPYGRFNPLLSQKKLKNADDRPSDFGELLQKILYQTYMYQIATNWFKIGSNSDFFEKTLIGRSALHLSLPLLLYTVDRITV